MLSGQVLPNRTLLALFAKQTGSTCELVTWLFDKVVRQGNNQTDGGGDYGTGV